MLYIFSFDNDQGPNGHYENYWNILPLIPMTNKTSLVKNIYLKTSSLELISVDNGDLVTNIKSIGELYVEESIGELDVDIS